LEASSVNSQNSDFAGALLGRSSGGSTKIHYCDSSNCFIRGNGNIGGLTGRLESGVVRYCKSSGVVNAIAGASCGGLIGRVTSNARIENSSSTADVSGKIFTGGLIGSLGTGSYINDSFATGVVEFDGSNGGGLVGNIENSPGIKIEHCYATGDVHGDGNDINAGGLVGRMTNDARVVDSYATGATGNISSNGGGLVGFMMDSTKIEKSYATGEITNISTNGGGLVGYLQGTAQIEESYATGNVSIPGDFAGGLAGYLAEDSEINFCYATGNVSADNFAGGLVGMTNTTDIVNSYSRSITVIATTDSAGGFVGRVDNGNLRASYSTATNIISGGAIGGMVGSGANVGNHDSYYDSDLSGLADLCGTPTSTADMKLQATYLIAGWDFDNIWAINPLLNDGYPYLQNVPLP
jgi:hypothetical protein